MYESDRSSTAGAAERVKISAKSFLVVITIWLLFLLILMIDI
jgi:hypothetical protein